MAVMIYTTEDLCLNVLLTSICNVRCSWCIANEYMSEIEPLQLMPTENVQQIIEMLKKEPVQQVNLLGGEPSLHPKALDIGEKIYKLGIHVGFSTNGLWSDEFRQKFEKVNFPLEVELTYLSSSMYSTHNQRKLLTTFKQLRNHPTSLGLILTSPDQKYIEHLDIAQEYGFDLRWVFMEPAEHLGITESYKTQRNIKTLGELAVKIIQEANDRGLATWADLTVPRCAIDNEDIALFEGSRNDIQFKCPPFFDISPSLDIWRCLPLAPKVTHKLTEFVSFQSAYNTVNQIKEIYSAIGCFPECSKCSYLEDICTGGPAITKRLRKI